jgi:hypothetical protein
VDVGVEPLSRVSVPPGSTSDNARIPASPHGRVPLGGRQVPRSDVEAPSQVVRPGTGRGSPVEGPLDDDQAPTHPVVDTVEVLKHLPRAKEASTRRIDASLNLVEGRDGHDQYASTPCNDGLST